MYSTSSCNRAGFPIAFLATLLTATSAQTSPGLAVGAHESQRSDPVESRETPVAKEARGRLDLDYGKLPLTFEPNQGQSHPTVKFLARGPDYSLFLTPSGATLSLQHEQARSGNLSGPSAVLRIEMVEANPDPSLSGEDPQSGKVNYFRGKDPKGWHTGIPTFGKIRYREVYPGIDMLFYSSQGNLAFDLVLRPGADPKVIQIGFDGAEEMRLDERGNLIIGLGRGEVFQRRPLVYQESDGARQLVPTRYVLADNGRVSLDVGEYDAGRTLTIDPELVYSTYLGGSDSESGHDIAIDATGHAYVIGTTYSADFPTQNALQPEISRIDAFITKLSPDGDALVYSTFLGGSALEAGAGIAVDGAGNVYVTGTTSSPDFPTHRALQPDLSGDDDAFVAKLAPDGATLVYSTYLGGSHREQGNGIAAEAGGYAYVTGSTTSWLDFPTHNAFQPAPGGTTGASDAFIAKLAPDGSALVYSSYLGGRNSDGGAGVAVDGHGNLYVTGYTQSDDFPTHNSLQPVFGGVTDGFVAKLTLDGKALAYATYLGGNGSDAARDITVDVAGNAYVAGVTESVDFPIRDAIQPWGGRPYQSDAFIAKIASEGEDLLFSTYLGGSYADHARGIALDGAGDIYVTGFTSCTDFPIRNAPQPSCGGGGDAFVAKLDSDGTALLYSTFLGGFEIDEGTGIAVDASGNAYVTGTTLSSGFPTRNALQARNRGAYDVFVTKIDASIPPPILPLKLLSLGDLLGVGIPGIAALLREPDTGITTAVIKDAATGTSVQNIKFDPAYTPVDMVSMPDLDGNGAPELALLARGRDVQVEVRDAVTGATVSRVRFDPMFEPKHLALVPDLNGNGTPELGVLGRHHLTGALAAEIKDSHSGDPIARVYFNPTFEPLHFDVVGDVDLNGAVELAVLGVNPEQRVRVELRDALGGHSVANLWYPKGAEPIDLAVAPDSEGNGASGVTLLSRMKKSLQATTIDARGSEPRVTTYFNPRFSPRQIVALGDINSSGESELAVLGIDLKGQVKAEIRSAVSGTLVANVWFGELAPTELTVIPDMNANGSVELALLGITPDDEILVIIKDALTKELLRTIRF